MSKFRFLAILLAAFGLTLFTFDANPIVAQEETAESEASSETTEQETTEQETAEQESTEQEPVDKESDISDDSLASLKLLWVNLNQKLDEKQLEYSDASGSDQPAILQEYESLISEANSLVEKITSTALEELNTAENKQPAFESLVGVMINDAYFQRDAKVFELGQSLIDAGIEPKYFEAAKNFKDRLDNAGREVFSELLIRLEQSKDNLPQVKMSTSKGDIVVELFEKEAPETVGNFISLVEADFYDGKSFFKVIEGMGAISGCSTGDGSGDAGYKIRCECYNEVTRNHFAGSLSMEHSGSPHTGGSQFLICSERTNSVKLRDNKHTVFGRIISGFDVVEKIQQVNPELPNQPDADVIVDIEVLQKTPGREYKPNKVEGSESADETPADDSDDGADAENESEGQDADGESEGDEDQ